MPNDLKDTLERFLAELPASLEALRRDAAETDASLLPLDLSFESLDRVEDYFRCVLERESTSGALAVIRDRVATYVGSTLIDRVGGEPPPSWRTPRIARQCAGVFDEEEAATATGSAGTALVHA